MSEASQLYYLSSEKIEELETQIEELQESCDSEIKKVKAHTEKELKNVIAKKKNQNKKLFLFLGALSVMIFAVGVFTDEGLTFNKEKVSFVLEHVASIVISSSSGGVCVYLFTKEKEK